MRFALITIIFILSLVVAGVLLQIFLSKRENKWPGLILPLITFTVSSLVVIGLVFFTPLIRTESVESVIENGAVIEQTVPEMSTQRITDTGTLILSGIYLFLVYNIPTVVLLAIYAACRGKRNRQRALKKMSVQDLE